MAYQYDPTGDEDFGNGVAGWRFRDDVTGESMLVPSTDPMAQQLRSQAVPREPVAPPGALAVRSGNASTQGSPSLGGASYQERIQRGDLGNPEDVPFETRSDATSTDFRVVPDEKPKRDLRRFAPPGQQQAQQQQMDPRSEREMMAEQGYTWQSGRAARPAEWIPTARARSIDQESASAIGENLKQASGLDQQAATTGVEMKYDDIKRQREEAMLQSLRTRDQIATEQADMLQKQAAVAERMSQFDAEYEQEAQKRVDTGSGGNEFLEAIAVALGAFGAALAGGPNTALEIVNKRTDRRIREQERAKQERLGSIDAARNDYLRLLDRGESPAQAKAHIRFLENKKLEEEARNMALSGQYGNKEAELQQVAQLAGAEAARQRAQFEQLTAAQEQERYIPAQSAVAPGYRPMTDKELAARRKEMDRINKDAKDYEQALMQQGVTKDEAQSQAWRRMRANMANSGMKSFTPDEQKWFGARWGRGVTDALFGEGTSAEWYDAPEEAQAKRDLRMAKVLALQGISGASIDKQTLREYTAGIEGANSIDKLDEIMARFDANVAAKKASTAAGYNPQAVQLREQRYNQLMPKQKERDFKLTD